MKWYETAEEWRNDAGGAMKMKLALLVAVMTVTMGWWQAQARGDETNRPAATGPIPRFTIQADMKSASAPSAGAGFGKTCLIEGGKPNADIVIADKPARAAKLAALELQTYLAKISGATLPITTRLQTNAAVHIYVGRSEYTDTLKISDEGLKYGAFRMVSGKDYLALLGHDKDIAMSEYAARTASPAEGQRAQKAWDARTGKNWATPCAIAWWGYSPRGISSVAAWMCASKG